MMKELYDLSQHVIPPQPRDLATSGKMTVSLELVLGHHQQDVSKYLGEQINFLGIEVALRSAEDAVIGEYRHMQAVEFLRRRDVYGQQNTDNRVKVARLHIGEETKYGNNVSALAVGKGVPLVFLERWKDEGELAGYKKIEELCTVSQNKMTHRFVSGQLDDALGYAYMYAVLSTISVKARDREIARNILRLDDILGTHYFGLHDKPALHGIGFVGSMHYGILDIIQNAQGADGEVKVSLHPTSVNPDEVLKASYTGEAMDIIGKKVELTADLDNVEAQLNALWDTFEGMRDIFWRICAEELILFLLPKSTPSQTFEQLDRGMLNILLAARHINGMLSPENIIGLSERIGEKWYNGQKLPLSGNQMKRLKNVVNGFLSEVGCPTIPTTTREFDDFVKTYVA
ncbi:hypothetical protein HYV85_01955 [Candidatus Woesearchaeota archaeon]|nr:hypothetical protein [Candidatus Woesearchaeota archaeon]